MSGHNKWSKIKHKKAITDAQKSKVFTKYTRLISNEIKKANGDINNFEVKNLIEKAKKENVPKENIERAVKNASNKNKNLEKVVYETYGPAGSGIVIIVLTDNRNRTAAEIRHILLKNGGYVLVAENSVLWLFEKNSNNDLKIKSGLDLKVNESDKEKLFRLIEKIEENEDVIDIYTSVIF